MITALTIATNNNIKISRNNINCSRKALSMKTGSYIFLYIFSAFSFSLFVHDF